MHIDATKSNATKSWTELVIETAKTHRLTLSALLIGLAGFIGLLTQGLLSQTTLLQSAEFQLAFKGSMVAFAAAVLGALPVLAIRSIPQRVEDSLLGFAAGMMLSACAFSLLIPGLEAGRTIFGSPNMGALVVIAGIGIGVLLMLGLDTFTPHEHDKTGPCGAGHEQCARLWLFVFAIALHNIPEGMAIGVSFTQGDLSVGVPLTTAIALQNIPEGLAVALALKGIGLSAIKSFAVAALSGFMEPLGALLGFTLSSGMVFAYPMGLGLAAGAMLFVVSHEVIPETHRNGHQTTATIGLIIGFALMMFLDFSLA